MSITASSLYRDTGNFFRHQLVTILLMALLAAFISVIVGHALTPDNDQLALLGKTDFSGMNLPEMVQNMTPDQQRILLRVSAAGTAAALLGNTLLLGGMLSLIPQVTAGQRTSALRAIGHAAPLLPRLLLLSFLMTLIIQIGFMALMVPGVILAVLLSLAPVILSAEKRGIFAAMRLSISLTWQNMRLVAPSVIFWLLAKVTLLLIVPSIAALPATLAAVLINGVNNLISALLIIWLCRLYMLLR